MIIKSVDDALGMNCLDVITSPDGQFTFKVFRKDPEDQGRWSLVVDYSGLQFTTEGEAFRAAAVRFHGQQNCLLYWKLSKVKAFLPAAGSKLLTCANFQYGC